MCWVVSKSSAASQLPRLTPGVALPSSRRTHPALVAVVALVVTGLVGISGNGDEKAPGTLLIY